MVIQDWRKIAAALAIILASEAPLAAQESYPSHPINLVIPDPPGGGFDAVGRLVGDRLAGIIGQPIVIVNKPGAGSTLGIGYGAKSKPDGYTLVLGGPASLAIAPNIYPDLAYDPRKDLAPVGMIGGTAYFIVVHPDVASDLKDLIAKAKKDPGKLSYGHPGVGSTLNLTMELFKSMTGTNIVQIPYTGTAPTLVDVMAGRVQVTLGPQVVLPYVRSGALRALAVTSVQRSSLMPEVPTVAEQGVPGYESTGWYAILAPAGTPKPIIDKLNAAINQVLGSDSFKDDAAKLGLDLSGGTPEDLAKKIDDDLKKWKSVVEIAGVKPETGKKAE